MISDASPLIIFAKAGRLGLLRQVAGTITVPEAVWREITCDMTKPGAAEIRGATWIRRGDVDSHAANLLRAYTDAGEAEAIALALQTRQLLLLDDRRARKIAEGLGVDLVGSVGVLLTAKRQGLVESVRDTLDDLLSAGLRLSDSLRQAALEEAGEA